MQRLERRGFWFNVWNEIQLTRNKEARGKHPKQLKEKKMCVNHPNLLDSQTFLILLAYHPNLSHTLLLNNPPTILVTVSGKFVCQKMRGFREFGIFPHGQQKATGVTRHFPPPLPPSGVHSASGAGPLPLKNKKDIPRRAGSAYTQITWHKWPLQVPQNFTLPAESASKWKRYWGEKKRGSLPYLHPRKRVGKPMLFCSCLLRREGSRQLQQAWLRQLGSFSSPSLSSCTR